MKKTYRAIQISRPGVLELVNRDIPVPGPGEVLIQVEACGMCGADLRDIQNAEPSRQRVPGHEVVGRIIAIGSGTPAIWGLGQRVGVGRLGGHCNACESCRRGQFQLCQNQQVVGASCDGGYAEMMLARSTGLVAIPDELDAIEAAPILCAGLATFNALKKCGAEAGDLVAILGLGGLGHMAVQYARKMGFKVIAIGRGADLAEAARQLGAHDYIDTNEQDAPSRLKLLGGAVAIVSTIPDMATVSHVATGLTAHGRLMLLGAGPASLSLSSGYMVGGERSVQGSLTGTPYDNEKTLGFSVLTDIRPQIETMHLAQANEAYQRLLKGDIKFRMVLTMTDK